MFMTIPLKITDSTFFLIILENIEFWDVIYEILGKYSKILKMQEKYRNKGSLDTRHVFRDRPFNLQGGLWLFVSFRIFFSDSTRVRILFFCRAKREFFFKNLTLGYMTKTHQIIFFPPPK